MESCNQYVLSSFTYCSNCLPLFLFLQVRLLYCSLEEAEIIFRAAWAAGQAGPSHMWFAVGPALAGLGLEGLPKALFAIRPQGWRDEPRRYEPSRWAFKFQGFPVEFMQVACCNVLWTTSYIIRPFLMHICQDLCDLPNIQILSKAAKYIPAAKDLNKDKEKSRNKARQSSDFVVRTPAFPSKSSRQNQHSINIITS